MAGTTRPIVSYYWNGWKQYASAVPAAFNAASPTAEFAYIPSAGANKGRRITVKGTKVPYAIVKLKGASSQLPDGSHYYVRASAYGPSFFAINSGAGSTAGFDFATKKPSGAIAPIKRPVDPGSAGPANKPTPVAKPASKLGWLAATLPLGVFALFLGGKKK